MSDYETSSGKESLMARRFRSSADWFVASEDAGIHVARIGASGERAVDLVLALANLLHEDVDVALESTRNAQSWSGSALPVANVRDAVARLKLPLTTYGGVELAIYTPNVQFTLTPELEVVVYSRSRRWFDVLRALGLEERELAPPAVWRPTRRPLAEAPELHVALEATVSRLGLVSSAPDPDHRT